MAAPEVPKTMSGILIEKTGGREVLQYREDLPVPVPKDGQVLVKNDLIGVNFIDTYFRTGLYPLPSLPAILGREAVGTIAALPASGNSPHKLGARVATNCNNGAYAAYSIVAQDDAFPIPDGVGDETACAALLQGLTALTLMNEAHDVKRGEWVLVHAGAGGMGQLLLQVGAARGAHVITTASTEAKRAVCKELGAEVVTDYEHVEEVVKERTGGKGVAAVFDGVGKATFDQDFRLVARKGTIVSYGNASGAVEPFLIRRLMEKNVKLTRPTMYQYIVEKDEKDFYIKQLWDALAKGFKVNIHGVYPLKDAAKAQEDLEGRKSVGKLLLKP